MSESVDWQDTDLPLILPHLIPGGICHCRDDIPTETERISWDEVYEYYHAEVEICENCGGVRGDPEIERTHFRALPRGLFR